MQEYCNAGSLREAVLDGCFLSEAAGGVPHRWHAIAGTLTDIASGMEYLHSRRCCHGDLNPSNILFKVRCQQASSSCACAYTPACVVCELSMLC